MLRLRNRTYGKWELRGGLPLPNSEITPEVQFYALVLQQAVPEGRPKRPVDHVFEVGCRNWSYLPAVGRFFEGKAQRLTGVELDGGRRHYNGYRRIDYARAQAAAFNAAVPAGPLAEARYADFLGLRAPAAGEGARGLVSFFPFVSEGPARAWGVPPRPFADFPRFLRHACEGGFVRSKGDFVLTVHQGEWEAEIAARAYSECPTLQDLPLHRACVPPEAYRGLWPSAAEIHSFWVEIP